MQCLLDTPKPHFSPALPPQAMPVPSFPLPRPPTLESALTLLSLACPHLQNVPRIPPLPTAHHPCPSLADSQLSSQKDYFNIPIWSETSSVPHLPHSSLSHAVASDPHAPSPVACLAPPLLSSHLLPGLQPTSLLIVPVAQWSPSGHGAFAQAVPSAWNALSSDLAR